MLQERPNLLLPVFDIMATTTVMHCGVLKIDLASPMLLFKPHVVVQAHLNNLTKMSPVSENDTSSISNYSRAINIIVWTFEDLGYDDDLKAASNVKTAVEKLPTSMILKWNEHLLHNKVSRPTLTVLAKWLQEQAEAHELLPMRGKPKYKPPGKWNGSHHGNGPGSNVNGQFNNALSAHPDAGTPTPCALGDGNHPTSRCPQFIALNPDDRAEKVKETKLCFCCLSPGHLFEIALPRRSATPVAARKGIIL